MCVCVYRRQYQHQYTPELISNILVLSKRIPPLYNILYAPAHVLTPPFLESSTPTSIKTGIAIFFFFLLFFFIISIYVNPPIL